MDVLAVRLHMEVQPMTLQEKVLQADMAGYRMPQEPIRPSWALDEGALIKRPSFT
ncbi:MAG: hypothetical protein GX781_00710 [Clostridiales bacterium]|nr:hypothetical protein [Clostridiales bacterium]